MRDFEACAANFADPAATMFMGGVIDRRAAWRIFAAQTGSWFLNGGGWRAIQQREGGSVVGTVGAFLRETTETSTWRAQYLSARWARLDTFTHGNRSALRNPAPWPPDQVQRCSEQ